MNNSPVQIMAETRLLLTLLVFVLIGSVLILLGGIYTQDVLVSVGLAVIPGAIVAGVIGWLSRVALLDRLQKSYELRGDLEASGLRRVTESLTDDEMLSGMRGEKPLNDDEAHCFIVQTWVPNPESMIRIIDAGLKKGYNFTVVVCNPESNYISERYTRMFSNTPQKDVSNEARHSILRVARTFPKALEEKRLRVYQHDQSNGMCVYKIGAFAWLSFFADKKSAILGPQLCVDANCSNIMYNAARMHYLSLIDELTPLDSSEFIPDDTKGKGAR